MDSIPTKVSIIIPVYNERELLLHVLRGLDDVEIPLNKEIIIIDDCSTDGTMEIVKSLDTSKYRIVLKDKNEGKGSALREGFKLASGDIVMVQDADLEYSLEDYHDLLNPILHGDADVVYGSRFLDIRRFNSPYRFHIVNNKMITFVSNIFTGLKLTDMETCYKVMRRDVLESFKDKLKSNRFGIEPEITHHIARGGWSIIEVPISYKARTFDEGKKIRMSDGFAGVFHIIKFYFFSR